MDANREHLRAWLPWVDSNVDASHSREFIMASRLQFADETGLPLGIFFEGRIVGTIGCNDISMGNKSAEIGYWLAKDATGNGIITKCCRALINYCFSELQLNRIVIRAMVENAPSRAVPERLGFTLEGIARQVAMQNGVPIDLAVYSLLLDEWSG